MDDDRNINITSYNQQGGITAYQVNLQPGDRNLKNNGASQIESTLASQSFESISVTAVMGDQEAFRFASQIKNFLDSKGYTVKGVNQAIYREPVQGQIIELADPDGIVNIIIGGR